MRANIEKFISEFGVVVEPEASVASYPGGGDFPAVETVACFPSGQPPADGSYEGMGDLLPTCEPIQPTEDKEIIVSFLLEENGKEVTIYQESENMLFYTYGVPNEEPEWEYRGPILARIIATATSWGEDVESLTALSLALTDAGSRWTTWEADPYNIIAEAIAKVSHSHESHGFICVSAATGMVSRSVYIFRTSGWECAVSFTKGSFSDFHSITLLSPGGKMYRLC